MMDELVQDLVSALEQTSEQSKLGELWEEMVLSPLHQRRQIRRRRGRSKRYRESSLYPLQHRRCWIEASESSLDESIRYRENSSSTITASVASCSDSDDKTSTNRWRSITTRQSSWPESDSFTENNPGRHLRKRRKVKRMTTDVTVRLQQKLKVSGVDGKQRHRPSKMQHLSGSKKRSSAWVGAGRQTEGARLMGKKCWKRKVSKEHRDVADENMSEGLLAVRPPGTQAGPASRPHLWVDAVPGSASISSCELLLWILTSTLPPEKQSHCAGFSHTLLYHAMPANVSRGGVQLSRGLGNQSGERAKGVGWGVEWRSRTGWLGQTSSRFPGEACSLSHLLLVDVRGDDAGPSGQEDVQAGWTRYTTVRPIRETSSTCSSDPGLFTNDEGRQGDDEQSDWFFEGDCGVGTGVAGLLPSWDSDNQVSLKDNRPPSTFLQLARPSQRGYRYHSRLKRVPSYAACCIKKDRRQLPSKGNSMPVFHCAECLSGCLAAPERHYLSALSSRGGPTPPSRHAGPWRASASMQTNVSCAYQSQSDIRRKREIEAVSVTTTSDISLHSQRQKALKQATHFIRITSNFSTLETVGLSTPGLQSSSFLQGDHEEPERGWTSTPK
ncbi:hypothetical protein FQN60_009011 [Etheostoma spectabile]|uniref:G-patch domain-containing protein n=1 Tax=Etheostoma spectabile TaxID=54343 RepID=A0A5J5CRF2_9PERO|nr:hypothetical protein FQN60_009011 [Etheostoma spectabile]